MVIMMVVNIHDHFDDDDMRMDVQIEIYDGKPPTAKPLKGLQQLDGTHMVWLPKVSNGPLFEGGGEI